MFLIKGDSSKEHVYPTYGRQFLAYRWYKPILTAAIFGIFYMLLVFTLAAVVSVTAGIRSGSAGIGAIMNSIGSGYDDMDLANPVQDIFNLGGLALMIPALFIAALIVRDRPVTSYSSARGGWDHRLFWRIMPVAFLCIGIPILFNELLLNRNISNFDLRFTLVSFILVTIFGPLQCIAEEYLFRGLFMQTLGSWLRIPVVAVVLQALLFAAMHPYNNIGKAAILASGLTFGLAAWICRGIEASSAFHVVNNMTTFYLSGLNMCDISSQVYMKDLIIDAGGGILFVILLLVLKKRTNWFDQARKDDLAIANTRYSHNQELKTMKKAARNGSKEEKAALAAAEGVYFVVEGDPSEKKTEL